MASAKRDPVTKFCGRASSGPSGVQRLWIE